MSESLQGHLLIASPELMSPEFFRSVVLLVEHNENGAMGVVLNRPTTSSVDEVLTEARGEAPLRNDPVYLGGPCEGPLMAVHDAPSLGERSVLAGVHFSIETEHIEALAGAPEQAVRFFAGHAGWGPGQLEGEREQGAWGVVPASARDVFGPTEDLWQSLHDWLERARSLGEVPPDAVPRDPSHN